MYHYVYCSYENILSRKYIGVRSCKCHPFEDTKYFGSFKDKTFHPKYKDIISIFSSREEAIKEEIYLHNLYNVAVNPMFVNRAKQTVTGFDRQGIKLSEQERIELSRKRNTKGRPFTEEHRRKIGIANSKRTLSETTKQKISNSLKNRKDLKRIWCNDGKKETLISICPKNWNTGRLPFSKNKV